MDRVLGRWEILGVALTLSRRGTRAKEETAQWGVFIGSLSPRTGLLRML